MLAPNHRHLGAPQPCELGTQSIACESGYVLVVCQLSVLGSGPEMIKKLCAVCNRHCPSSFAENPLEMPRLSSRSLFMSLYLVFAVAALAPHVFAVPLSRPIEILPLAPRDSDDSIAVEKGWVSEPTTRGSIGLLWSCTLTIMLAVWSTLHLNVQMAADATLDDALDDSSANATFDDALDELSANATLDDQSSANATLDDQSSANATIGESSINGTLDDALDKSSAKASTTPSRLRWLRRQLSPNHRVGWKYKFFWALLTLLVPELPLAVSLGELWLSRDLLREVKKEAPEAFMKWDLTMAFYVVMGGFYVHL
jgi:hypothetical protein